MIQHFRLAPFVAGLLAGFVLIRYYKAPPLVVHEYPHPQNVQGRVYRDNNGVCYRYSARDVDCNANESRLRAYPLGA